MTAIKKFLGKEVRVVDGEWIVLKDMFTIIGEIRPDGRVKETAKKKLYAYLEGINRLSLAQKMGVSLKREKGSKTKKSMELDCLKIDEVKSVLTLFMPKPKASQDVKDSWFEFMKFVDLLLQGHMGSIFDIADRKNQLNAQKRMQDAEGSPMILNIDTSRLMAYSVGIEGKLLKKDIRTFQDSRPDIRIDLGKVYEDIREKFVNAYELNGSHKESEEIVKKYIDRKYKQ